MGVAEPVRSQRRDIRCADDVGEALADVGVGGVPMAVMKT